MSNGSPSEAVPQHEVNRRNFIFIQSRLETMRAIASMGTSSVRSLNALVAEIAANGLVSHSVIRGQILSRRDYAPYEGGHDSDQVLQAALLVPGGIGILFWDSVEYERMERIPDALESRAADVFVPYEECSDIVQGLIARQYDDLAAKFVVVCERTGAFHFS